MNDNSGTNGAVYTFPGTYTFSTSAATPTYEKEEVTIGDWKVYTANGNVFRFHNAWVEHDTEDNSYTFFDEAGLLGIFPYSVVSSIVRRQDDEKQAKQMSEVFPA